MQAGDSAVRFKLRPWATYQTTAALANLTMTVAIPGGMLATKNMTGGAMLATKVMVGSNQIWLGDVVNVELPLPGGAASEVVVDLSTVDWTSSCGLQPTASSYLVDDLRVE